MKVGIEASNDLMKSWKIEGETDARRDRHKQQSCKIVQRRDA